MFVSYLEQQQSHHSHVMSALVQILANKQKLGC